MAGRKRIALSRFCAVFSVRQPLARVLWTVMIVGQLVLTGTRPATAQSDANDSAETAPPPAPLLVLHVQSFERILQRLRDNFREIDRDDVGEAFDEFLEGRAGGLKGFDRAQPFGVALFLPESLPPRRTSTKPRGPVMPAASARTRSVPMSATAMNIRTSER